MCELNNHTPLEKVLGAYLRRQIYGECLEIEQLEALMQRSKHAPDYEMLMRHLTECEACQRAFFHLWAIRQYRRAHGLKDALLTARQIWVPALGVLVIALIGGWWLTSFYASPSEQPRIAIPEKAITVAQAHPRIPEAFPRLAPEITRLTVPSVPPSDPLQQEFILAVQKAPHLRPAIQEAVHLLSALRPPTQRYAETPPMTPLHVLTPDIEQNYAIVDRQPTFSWRCDMEVRRYRFTLYTKDNSEPILQRNLEPTHTELTLPAPLSPATEYELVLVVETDSQELVLRRRFWTLSDDQLTLMRWAQAHRQQTPLLCAALFYSLDRYADALECLQQARQRYPNDPLLGKWLQTVRQRVQYREAELIVNVE